MLIGEAISKIREVLNMNQCEFAKRAGLSQTALSQIETGKKHPRQSTIDRICTAYEIPEAIIYMIALERDDIVDEKKELYSVLHSAIEGLALEIVLNNPSIKIIMRNNKSTILIK